LCKMLLPPEFPGAGNPGNFHPKRLNNLELRAVLPRRNKALKEAIRKNREYRSLTVQLNHRGGWNCFFKAITARPPDTNLMFIIGPFLLVLENTTSRLLAFPNLGSPAARCVSKREQPEPYAKSPPGNTKRGYNSAK
jgi:hypothetical protein